MKKEKKRKIEISRESIQYELEGNLNEAINFLQDKRGYVERQSDSIEGFEAKIDWDQYQYEDNYSLFLVYYRDETDKEFEQRLKKEKNIQKQQEKSELEQYERLKKKFENNEYGNLAT